ncbi:MAG: hypothetical protein M1423_03235 [Acidobacteria bacterium]|nr:hypothetical protein [Acidobacteriota bacterium]
MTIIERTQKLLCDTERGLTELANEAGVDRKYDQAASLIELASKIKQLGEHLQNSSDVPPKDSAPPATPKQLYAVSEAGRRFRSRLGQYPKFFREGENLVKIGWSKSARAEYEHKSPKRALEVLCNSLANAKGKRIAMDKVLPLKDPVTGAAFSDYQAYVCLAWLRTVGLVVQHGRQGYSIPGGSELRTLLEARWANLPSR